MAGGGSEAPARPVRQRLMRRDRSVGQFVGWRMVRWSGVAMVVFGVALSLDGLVIPGGLFLLAGLVVFAVWVRHEAGEHRR